MNSVIDSVKPPEGEILFRFPVKAGELIDGNRVRREALNFRIGLRDFLTDEETQFADEAYASMEKSVELIYCHRAQFGSILASNIHQPIPEHELIP